MRSGNSEGASIYMPCPRACACFERSVKAITKSYPSLHRYNPPSPHAIW